MLHGKGIANSDGDQSFLTKKCNKKRQIGLEDITSLSDDDLTKYGLTNTDGGGKTSPDTLQIKQYPFPTDTTIRKKQTIDLKKVDPTLGEMSD